ncbi:hypothetical protein KCU77_g9295, partial [Aureobasidium melanogenum]
MTTLAVVRDDFVSNDVFFAQVDQNKRHPRASVAELTFLLPPETSPAPPSKDQNTTKVRLLQALNANTLSVPDHVTKLEKDMKKEFNAAARKAKAAEKTPTTPPKGKKRTHEEATTNTKITLTVGGVSITVDQQTAASITSAVAGVSDPAPKKAKVAKEDAAPIRSQKTKDAATEVKSKKSAPDTKTTKAKPSSTTEKLTKPKDASAVTKLKAEPKAKKQAEEKHSPPPARTKQTARRSKPFNPLPADRPIGVHPQHTHNHAPSTWDELPHIKSESDRDINGTYLLHLRSHSPENVPQFNGPPRISVHHDIYTNKLWGHFTIGLKTGVIRVDDFYLDASRVCNFNWRARDMGVMELGIHGLDRGTFYRLFDGVGVDFGVSSITRDTQMDWSDWMDQWEGHVKEAYSFEQPIEDELTKPRFRTKQTARKK